MSLSKISRVDLIFLVIKSLADRITELDGANGIATKLLIVAVSYTHLTLPTTTSV